MGNQQASLTLKRPLGRKQGTRSDDLYTLWVTCSNCGDRESRTALVEEVFRIDGAYVLVGHIPAQVCARCGEETFSRETAEKIRLMVHSQATPTRSIPLRVFEYVRQ